MDSRPSVAPRAAKPGLRWLPGLLVMPLRAAEQHVLGVVGEADSGTADQLRDHLAAALSGRPPSLVVDLAGLDFCDLSGLDALHDGLRLAEAASVPLTFRGMPAQLTWLHRTFPPRPADPSASRQPGTPRPAAAGPPRSRPAGATQSSRNAPTAVRAAGAAPRDPGTAAPATPDVRALNGGYGAARGTGADSEVLHAVPPGDTTRSAACGARVRRTAGATWGRADDAGACADCTAVLARAVRGNQPPYAPRSTVTGRSATPRPAGRSTSAPRGRHVPGQRRAQPPGHLRRPGDERQHPDPAA